MTKVLLFRSHGRHFWFDKVVHFFTGSWYYHAALWIDGMQYEDAAYFSPDGVWHEGAMRHSVPHPGGDHFVLVDGMTNEQERKVRTWCEQHLYAQYNFPKLVGMAIIYPFRWFFKLIGWVPFSRAVFGYICSEYVDRAFKTAGIDLLPGAREGYTAPGDLAKSKLLRMQGESTVMSKQIGGITGGDDSTTTETER